MSTIFHKLFDEYGDDRVRDWFLMSSPFSLISILIFYVILTKFIIKPFMKNREPLKLKSIIIVWNSLKIILNLILFYIIIKNGMLNDHSFTCQPIDRSDNEEALFAITICWFVMLAKLLDLLDTVFMLLKKKDEQVTFLHTFHYLSIPTVCKYYGT